MEVEQWSDSYLQYFTGESSLHWLSCDAQAVIVEMVRRKRQTDTEREHSYHARMRDPNVNVDTTVQEKNITFRQMPSQYFLSVLEN